MNMSQTNLTTLCYLEKDDCYLMMHRISKKNDMNAGKWIGVGGHFENNESPEDCLLREVKEETGLTLTDYRLRAIITFISNESGCEYMHLYTATGFEGVLDENCTEGILKWIPKKDVETLNLWEGDKIFLKLLLETNSFFSLKLEYEGDNLVNVVSKIYD